MASSSLDSKCPCCKQKYFSEYKSWFQHIQDCSLEKFTDKDADHMKYTVSYEYSLCQSPLSSQLRVIQHTNDCAPVYAMYLGFDDPSLVSDLSSTSAVNTVFSFNDKDWVVSKNEDCC